MMKLGDRERQVVRFIAWGASQKEVADELGISRRTVDNIVRRVKEKLHLQKNTELSAWFFCTSFGISFDLSPLKRKLGAVILAVLLFHGELTGNRVFCRYRGNLPRIEWRQAARRKNDGVS